MSEASPPSPFQGRRLVIAGGGLAGWLAAAVLQSHLGRQGWSVTVVAPPRDEARGMAVATGPNFNRLLQLIGLDRERLLRRCHGTYRLGNLFADWVAPGRSHLWPFGPCGPRPQGHDLFHYWLRARQGGLAVPDYGAHALVGRLAEQGFGPLQQQGRSPVEEEGDEGFHLDGEALVHLLRDVALAAGAHWLETRVAGVDRSDGRVAALSLRDGERLAADVFIDATGTAAALTGADPDNVFEVAPGSPIVVESLLSTASPDRRALTTYRANAEGYTETIPLLDHAVETRVRSALGETGAPILPGRRRRIWHANVLALGRAALVLPPLAGLELVVLQRSLERALDWWPRGTADGALRDAFNQAIDSDVMAAQEAVALHGLVSQRPDRFWADLKRASPATLRDRLSLYEAAGRIQPASEPVFSETAHYHLLVAAGRWPNDVFTPVAALDPQPCAQLLESVRAQNAGMMRPMLSHLACLARVHRRSEAELKSQAGEIASISMPSDRLAAVRAGAGGRALVELVAALGQPFAIERSVKAEAGVLQRERFLMSVHRSGLGPDPAGTLARLGLALGLPERYREAAAAAIAEADILHLGYEDGAHGPLYKLYVEWSARADRLWRDPQAEPGTEPVLVHRAYKWDPARPQRVVTTLYHWPRVRSVAEIRARLAALGADAGGAFTAGLADAVLDAVDRKGLGQPHFLEVSEEGSPRLSYDLNLYAAGLAVQGLAPIIGSAFRHLKVADHDIAEVLGEHGAETLGHIAAGVGRRGDPFVTVYFGGAAV